jgi:hypothetical protein
MRLYYHKTDGGAEYLCSANVPGTDEGVFEGSEYIVRLDGAPELIVRAVNAHNVLVEACQCALAFMEGEDHDNLHGDLAEVLRAALAQAEAAP